MSEPVTVPATPEPKAKPKPWMTTTEIAAYTGHHPNTILLAFHEYEATKDAKEPKGLKGFQRVVYGPWKSHQEDVDRWMQNLPPARGVRKFVPA